LIGRFLYLSSLCFDWDQGSKRGKKIAQGKNMGMKIKIKQRIDILCTWGVCQSKKIDFVKIFNIPVH